MSKYSNDERVSIPSDPIGYPMDGRVIYDYQIQSLEGKILTFIESLGLKESQEKSAKDIFRDVFYRAMYFELEMIHGIHLNEAIEKARKEKNPPGVAMSN